MTQTADRPKILIAEPIPDIAIDKLREAGRVTVAERGDLNTEKKLIKAMRDTDAFLSMLSNKVTKSVLEESKQLKIVANYAVGYNNIDITEASELGIRVANTPDVLTDATADLAIGLMIAAARKFPSAESNLREGEFTGWEPLGFRGIELSESVIGIIGMGRIGQAFAKRAGAFGAEIIYHNRNRVPRQTEKKLNAVYEQDLDRLLSRVDILSLHCPLTVDTHHLLNRKRLSLMQNHAIIVNTARGAVIEEEALADALTSQKIAGAGLDVYENEPSVHPDLLAAPNCILLPHIGSATFYARKKMAELAADAIIGVLQNRDESEIPNLIV